MAATPVGERSLWPFHLPSDKTAESQQRGVLGLPGRTIAACTALPVDSQASSASRKPLL